MNRFHSKLLLYNFNLHLLKLQPNCDINAREKSGCTPLYVAITEGNTYLIEQLVGHGADLNMKENEGCSPLHVLVFLEFSGVPVTFQPLSDNTPELLKVHIL